MENLGLFWGFNLFVLALLGLDLIAFHRKSHTVSIRESLLWSLFWIVLAAIFAVGIWKFYPRGEDAAFEFITGYIIEKCLSIDNLFVFLLIFSSFRVPPQFQHRVLFWGILGAIVLRIIFIYAGVELLHNFHWLIYLFGGFLIFTGLKMLKQEEDKEPDLNKHVVVRLTQRAIRVTKEYVGEKFFVRKDGLLYATPLFVVLLLIESSDVIFAVDSIPAVLAVTDDFIIVYTSNIFAIMGLRSLYFALSGIMGYFRFLKYALSVILVFVGTKMVIVDVYEVPIFVSLSVIIGMLAVAILASILFPSKAEPLPTVDNDIAE
jgi:tellurite resistance protein TerC